MRWRRRRLELCACVGVTVGAEVDGERDACVGDDIGVVVGPALVSTSARKSVPAFALRQAGTGACVGDNVGTTNVA